VYAHLLSPGRIGALQIRNRILMAPMGSNLAESDGTMGERIKRYYEERARGGVGLLIVGVGAIAFPAGACNPNQVAISDDRFIPDLRELTTRVHAQGAKVAMQLQHAGKVAVRDMVDGRAMWVPSEAKLKRGDLTHDLTAEEMQQFVGDLGQPGAKVHFHVMTERDIATLIEWFAAAAERAKRAGFDGIELHAGHGYMLSCFLSPATNHREDAYGGDIEGRARLLVEVIRAVKARVGAEFPVWCRIDAKEFRTPGGISEADGLRAAELAAEAGADAIHVSAYADSTSGVAFTDAPLVDEPGRYLPFAAAIKRRIDVPVIGVGRIEPEQADRMIAEGQIDFVAMARKLLADPELPNKLAAGQPEAVRPCIYCYTCVGQIFLNQPSCCVVNTASGREAEAEWAPAQTPKHVLVVGGGPAGMEAARIARLRGHRVTLWEQGQRLGGTAYFSSLVYPPNGRLVEWLEGQVRTLGVEIEVGRAATPDAVMRLAPDVVLVAVGAKREAPSVPGVEDPRVFSGDDLRALLTGEGQAAAAQGLGWVARVALLFARTIRLGARPELTRRLTRLWMPLGKRVVVVGGGLVGVELAEFLSERGRAVTVLESGPKLATEMAPPRRWRVLHTLREHGVDLKTSVRVVAIEAAGVVVGVGEDAQEEECVPADAIIWASGVVADTSLAETLRAAGHTVKAIGDCAGVGYIKGAMRDAADVARTL
jgi:2,4-dienoyl-CoA reductase-like NADH-dependent reductase (Old Yellow Enzyme family)/thioredoxin reductase